MAQHDYVIANGSGLEVREDIEDALQAAVSNNSGTSDPASPFACMWFDDTQNNLIKKRNSANTAWHVIGNLDQDYMGLAPQSFVQNGCWCFAVLAGGTVNYTASVTPAISAYANGQKYRLVVNATCTGAATINVNGKGAINLKNGRAAPGRTSPPGK